MFVSLTTITDQITEVLQNYEQAGPAFAQIALEFPESHFAERPSPTAWSSMDVTEHLWMVDRTGLLAMMKGPIDAGREPLERIQYLQQMMDAPGARFEAPEAASPRGKFSTREEALDAFLKQREKIMEFAVSNDLTMLASAFPHPRLGFLTRAEWIAFMAWHSGHHGKQVLRNRQQLGC